MKRLVRNYFNQAAKHLKIFKIPEDGELPRCGKRITRSGELLLGTLPTEVGLDVPKAHDVSRYLKENLKLFPDSIKESTDEIVEISRCLRKEGELSPLRRARLDSPRRICSR